MIEASEFSVFLHDLSQPLTTGLLALRDVRTSNLGLLSSESSGWVALEESLTQLKNLIDTARNKENQPVQEKETVILGHLLRGIVEMLQPYAQRHQVTLLCSLPEQLASFSIKTSATSLQRAITNLLFNAVESYESHTTYSETRCVLISLKLVAKNRPQLIIRDWGCGITPQQLPRIAEPGFTTKSLYTPRWNSVPHQGVGFKTARTLLERDCGAHFSLTSKTDTINQGTTCRITFESVI